MLPYAPHYITGLRAAPAPTPVATSRVCRLTSELELRCWGFVGAGSPHSRSFASRALYVTSHQPSARKPDIRSVHGACGCTPPTRAAPALRESCCRKGGVDEARHVVVRGHVLAERLEDVGLRDDVEERDVGIARSPPAARVVHLLLKQHRPQRRGGDEQRLRHGRHGGLVRERQLRFESRLVL